MKIYNEAIMQSVDKCSGCPNIKRIKRSNSTTSNKAMPFKITTRENRSVGSWGDVDVFYKIGLI